MTGGLVNTAWAEAAARQAARRTLAATQKRYRHPRHGAPWSAQEDSRLLELAARHAKSPQRWQRVAKLLKRTVLAVQGRYHLVRAMARRSR